MRFHEICEARTKGVLSRIVADPHSFIYPILDAMMTFGIDAPENEDGNETDEEALAGMIHHWASNLLPYVHNGFMTVYRAMTVPDDWEPKSLGLSWSFLPEFAVAYNAKNRRLAVILRGEVSEDEINMPVTVALQELTEEEVRLLTGAEVTITAATLKDGTPVLQHLIGKTYPA
jgi:hypothetical protein